MPIEMSIQVVALQQGAAFEAGHHVAGQLGHVVKIDLESDITHPLRKFVQWLPMGPTDGSARRRVSSWARIAAGEGVEPPLTAGVGSAPSRAPRR